MAFTDIRQRNSLTLVKEKRSLLVVPLAGFEALALLGGLGIYFGLGGYFEWIYYHRRKADPESWKIQPRRFTAPPRRRAEIAKSVLNLTGASLLSGYLAYRVATDNPTFVYVSEVRYGTAYGIAATLGYFLVTDFGLYWMHRLMHHPVLFRAIHRWHHQTLSPTAFTASAMHPFEFAVYQVVAMSPLFVFPIPAWGVVMTLLFHNVVALFDHSGVDMAAWFPWQPPPRFHDDHHAHFHVNYGQTLGIWDRMFGTWRCEGRTYGEHVFGGRGAPDALLNDHRPPRRVSYARKAIAP
jgi:lathosterol oxidase